MEKKTILLLGIIVVILSSCTSPATLVPPTTPTQTASPSQATTTPALAPVHQPASVPYHKMIIGYYPSWAPGRSVFLKDIPYAQLTHINYAFSDVSKDGACILGDRAADVERSYSPVETIAGKEDDPSLPFSGNFNQIRLLKQQYPELKVLIAIGGWSFSSNFSLAATDDASRQRFASSCIDLYLKKYPGVFDGLDIDWEYPVDGGMTSGKPEDKANYTLLLKELRRQLDARGKADSRRYLLTITAPVGPGSIRNFDLLNMVRVVDWMNLMAYDFHGAWDKSTNFNAPLFRTENDPADPALTVDAAVQTYIFNAVPPQKIVLGVPFYGYGWTGVSADGNGLYQKAAGNLGTGAFSYTEIITNYLPAAQRFWSEAAHVPWLYDAKQGAFITYDDPQSIEAKAGYARDQGLAGVMIWDLSQGDASLVDAIYKGFQAGGPTMPTPEPLGSEPRPFEASIHQVTNITVDGKLDDWTRDPDFTLNDQSQVVFSLATNSWGGPKDLSANVWIGWAPDGIYGAFQVVDDVHIQAVSDSSLWHGDYMEMQVDTQLDADYAASSMDDDDYQIGLSVGDFTSVPPVAYAWFNGPNPGGTISEVKMAFVKTAAGYNLEVLIPKDVLAGIILSAGATFGMNASPSDADDAAQGQKVMLSTSKSRTYSDPRTFGKITLVK